MKDTFSVDRCTNCNAERYLYNLYGELVIGKDGKIFIKDNACREINLADWLNSWGTRNGKHLKISVEKIKEGDE